MDRGKFSRSLLKRNADVLYPVRCLFRAYAWMCGLCEWKIEMDGGLEEGKDTGKVRKERNGLLVRKVENIL